MTRSIVLAAPTVCSVDQDEVPRFGGGHGDADRLVIAHLAEQDDVGRLAERGAQRRHIALGVGRDLPLADDGMLVPVEELDGVLQRDDVGAAGVVDRVDHAGERRRFAAPGRAGDEHESLLHLREGEHPVWDAEVVRVGQLKGDDADDRGERTALFVGADPKARHPLEREGEVVVASAFDDGDLPARERVGPLDEGLGVGGGEPSVVGAQELAVDLEGHRQPGNDEDVGSAAVHRVLKEMQDIHLDYLRCNGSEGAVPQLDGLVALPLPGGGGLPPQNFVARPPGPG